MQQIKFTKMHGIGNDYIYINCFEQKIDDPQTLARAYGRQGEHRSAATD